ncbi:MAG: deoxyribonuclease IV [Thermoanaerobaculia bacterium]|nr:deoxyribonuclease IV [Thermoanaerobaculia bacterium]
MAPPPPRLGAHVSAAGGVHRALERARAAGCETAQIFVKSPNRWRGPEIADTAAAAFRDGRGDLPGPVVAHAAYLVNLAATDRTVLRRSRRALADELRRCDLLGVDALVVHPGAHLGAGPERGVARVARSVRRVLDEHPPDCRLLLENTAGQGTVLGRHLEELTAMLGAIRRPRVGVCIDTCHAFAAGYPVHTRRGYDRFWDEVDEKIGLAAVGCLHLNDSRFPLGSRRDRHANLGDGEIGPASFRRLVGDPRLLEVPMILETPLGEDGQGHARDLARLKRWRRRRAARG